LRRESISRRLFVLMRYILDWMKFIVLASAKVRRGGCGLAAGQREADRLNQGLEMVDETV
jgi:hypothetical protein